MTAIANPSVPVHPLTSTVAVNLLPREVLAGRRGRRTRRFVLIGLSLVVVLLVALSVFTQMQVGTAQSDLDAAQAQTTALQNRQRQFTDVVMKQGQAAGVAGQLATATATDIAWQPVLDAVRAALPATATLTGISATNAAAALGANGAAAVPAAPAPAAGSAGSGSTGDGAVANFGNVPASGELTLTGTADQQTTVAAFVDALSGSAMFQDVVATSVDGAQGAAGYTFTVTAGLTSVVVGSRYAPIGGK